MLSFLKSNPIMSGLFALVLIVAILALINSCDRREASEEANLVNQGATQERAQSQGEALNDVQVAKDAVERPTDDQLNQLCSKYDRNCPAAGNQ